MTRFKRNRRRRGSLIIEAVVALSLLGVAFVSLSRLAQSAGAINRQADARISALLAAQNARLMLKTIPYQTWRTRQSMPA